LKTKYKIPILKAVSDFYRDQVDPLFVLDKCYSRCYSEGNREIPTSSRGKFLWPILPLSTMPEITDTALEALRSRLTAATVYTPKSESYKDVIVRWSDTGMKYAVWKNARHNKMTK
jgi:hypothetical protein